MSLVCGCRLKHTRRGLGADSEQALESSHTDWRRIWERCRVRDLDSEIYSTNLLSAVLNFNSSHTPIRPDAEHNVLVDSDQRGIFQGPAGAVKYVILTRAVQ